MRLHLCELALRTGEWDLVARMLREWDQPSGEAHVAGPHARPLRRAAGRRPGRRRGGRADGRERDRGRDGDRRALGRARGAARAGIAALLRGDREPAAARLRWVWDYVVDAGVLDPGVFPVAADLVEAGGDADAVLARLRDAGDHPWARATLLRCEGAPEAVAAYRALGLQFDAARTLLAHGRREEAAAAFDALGSPGWAASLERTSLPSSGTATRSVSPSPCRRSRRSARVSVACETVSKWTATMRASGACAGERDDVVVVHHDRVALEEARGARVDDDRRRAGARRPRRGPRRRGSCRRRCRRVGSPGACSTKPETGAICSPISPVPWWPPVRAIAQVAERRVVRRTGPHVDEAVGAQALGVLRLAEQRAGRAGSSRRAVSSKWSLVQVGDEHGVEAGRRAPRRARAARRAGWGAGSACSGTAGARARGIELRIDEQRAGRRRATQQRRVADQGQVHVAMLAQDRHNIRRALAHVAVTHSAA